MLKKEFNMVKSVQNFPNLSNTLAVMNREITHRGVVIVLVLFLLELSRGQDCNFDDLCTWNIKKGFVKTDFQLILETSNGQKDIYTGLQNTTGKFAFYSPNFGGDGRIASKFLPSRTNGNHLCLSAHIYVGVVNETDNHGEIVLALVPTNGQDQSNTFKISDVQHNGWFLLTSEFAYHGGKYTVTIDVTLQDEHAFIAIDNITVNDNCDEGFDQECLDVESFKCDDSACVKWDKVCNLNNDCQDGTDEKYTLCDALPRAALCTFENGTCDWQNVNDDEGIDWRRYSGPSPTRGTGPTADHTTGNQGHYMYIESSSGDMFDFAILQSSVLPAIPEGGYNKCKLRFFYHMFGRVMGRLEVKIHDICTTNTQPIVMWSKEGSQEDKWLYAEIPIPKTRNRYILQFQGYAALLNHGDIAIDDVSLSPECFGLLHNDTDFLRNISSEAILTLPEFRQNPRTHCGIPKKDNSVKTMDTVTTTDSKVPMVMQAIPENLSRPTSDSMTETAIVQTLHKEPEKIPLEYIVIITIAAVIVAIVMGCTFVCLALRKHKERSIQSSHLEMISNMSEDNCNAVPVQQSSFDMQLRCAVTELNPNYEFITAKYPEQQLREIPRNKLTLIRLLGQGAFGEVYEGRLKNLCANVSELPVAVKTLPALSTEQAETDFLMEAVIISKFMHKNVVKCLGVCFDEHPRYIILELLKGGDLKTFLRDCRPKMDQHCSLTMEDLVKLALDIANGCRHLEEKHFVHRDVASRNCLLTSRGPERMAKIADFGMSRDIYSADYYRKGGKAMLPIKWMPPEAFLDGVFTTKTDIWSFGVLLWEILTLGYMPYPGQTNSDVMHYVASGGRLDPPENCPARLNKIMIMCWNSVADIRPSFNEIIEHLDMCLQDPEVMEVDPYDFHFPMGECFKDASTLANSATSHSASIDNSPDVPSENDTAAFGRHLESQSREPLLLSSVENV